MGEAKRKKRLASAAAVGITRRVSVGRIMSIELEFDAQPTLQTAQEVRESILPWHIAELLAAHMEERIAHGDPPPSVGVQWDTSNDTREIINERAELIRLFLGVDVGDERATHDAAAGVLGVTRAPVKPV